MKTDSYINKSTWGEGPWQDEPDSAEWYSEASGLLCAIKRAGMGHLCGYVLLPSSHECYGMDYDDIPADVHGGLTYAAHNNGHWKVGFDCAHWDDLCPDGGEAGRDHPIEAYWTFARVVEECENLARQLAVALPPVHPDHLPVDEQP